MKKGPDHSGEGYLGSPDTDLTLKDRRAPTIMHEVTAGPSPLVSCTLHGLRGDAPSNIEVVNDWRLSTERIHISFCNAGLAFGNFTLGAVNYTKPEEGTWVWW